MIEQLHRLGEATETLDVLDRVYVIDQGSDKVTQRPGFDEAAKKLGDLLAGGRAGEHRRIRRVRPGHGRDGAGRAAPTTSC